MYLAPHTVAGRGNVCPKASEGCRKACLYTAGRGSFSTVQTSRINKTKLFFDDNQQFLTILQNDLTMFAKYCKDNNLVGYVRLNGTSDIDWQKLTLSQSKSTVFNTFPELKFYDYTKDFKRISTYPNYKMTYSRSESTSLDELKRMISSNKNVAVVFDQLPSEWEGIPVINGDLDDLRYLDPTGVVVGLVQKGQAKKDKDDFVIRGFKQ